MFLPLILLLHIIINIIPGILFIVENLMLFVAVEMILL